MYRANRTLDYAEAVEECRALDATMVSPSSAVFNGDIAAMMINASVTNESLWVGLRYGQNALNPRMTWMFENGAYFLDEQFNMWSTR